MFDNVVSILLPIECQKNKIRCGLPHKSAAINNICHAKIQLVSIRYYILQDHILNRVLNNNIISCASLIPVCKAAPFPLLTLCL